MKIDRVSPSILEPSLSSVSVGIVDSGFFEPPSYAVIHNRNLRPRHPHGNRVLGVFTALDSSHPIPGLSLHLAAYDEESTYSGLAEAINSLPHCDILSVSIAWRDNRIDIRNLMREKADKILVAFSAHTATPYPSKWGSPFQSCSQSENAEADWSINPCSELIGNSYAVPAIARLMAYGHELSSGNDDGIAVEELFLESSAAAEAYYSDNTPAERNYKSLNCPHCHRSFLDAANTPMQSFPEKCPYCGRNPLSPQ